MKNLPTTHAELTQRFNAGEEFTFLHFWGHTPPKNGSVSKSCFSQWFAAGFTLDGVHYHTAEHYMMAAKARLFGDNKTCALILAASTPIEAKKLGRRVANYDDAVWLEHRFEIVCQANLAKFGQNPALLAFLQQTGEAVLVEASPEDRIWGIGLAAADPKANDPSLWQGENLLGFALMHVRQALQGS